VWAPLGNLPTYGWASVGARGGRSGSAPLIAWHMRGAGDQLSIGKRIAFYRRRRGLSQVVRANLVGRTEDWLSKIERGEREIRRLDVLADVARALEVVPRVVEVEVAVPRSVPAWW
jgi:hypothetical protein